MFFFLFICYGSNNEMGLIKIEYGSKNQNKDKYSTCFVIEKKTDESEKCISQ